MLDLESFVFDKEMDPVQIAIMLAMTRNQEEEKEMLRRYRGMGARCAVTMVSGSNAADRNKTLRSVVGLCLNERIVEKKTEHLHPVAARRILWWGKTSASRQRWCARTTGLPSASTAAWGCTSSPPTKPSALA